MTAYAKSAIWTGRGRISIPAPEDAHKENERTSQQPPDREGSEAFLLFFSYDAGSDARRLQSSNATKI